MQHFYKKIYADEKFSELVKKKSMFSWALAFIVMTIYFSFILVIAFFPELFAIPVSADSVISWGIPIGIFVIISSFILTGVYVYRANREFDRINTELLSHHAGNNDE